MSNARFSIAFGRFGVTSPPLWVAVVLPLSFFVTATLFISVFGANPPIWVSNAVAVAVLLRNKRSTWPILIVLEAGADYAASVVTGTPMVGLVACDSFEILLIPMLLSFIGVAWPLKNIWSLAKLALVCLLVPGVSATGGAGLLSIAYGAPFLAGWKTWYLSDICGLLIVTPLLLSWTDPAIRTLNLRGQNVQSIVLVGFIAAFTYFDFHDGLPDSFIAFPLLLVATFTGGLFGATTGAAAQAAVAIWCTMTGSGDLAAFAKGDPVLEIQLLQMYVAIIVLLVLPVAAILEQLRERTREAQAAARAKSEFLAVMSHEIRTPMTGVLGMTDLLMNLDLLPPKARDYVKGIRTSGQHLLALVNDILDFSRIEAEKLELEIIDFSVDCLFEQMRSLLVPQATECGLELHFAYDADMPKMLKGDPTRIKQVLVNLAGNGLKFTSRGSVTIAVARCAGQAGRDRYRFEVRDTGIGIPEEKQPLLFEAFSQVDSSTTRQYGGSGLGLAICRKLVNAMGGEIGVESVPGIGSCFWFEMPLALGETPLTGAPARQELVAGPSRRVLLAEDVELNQVLITDMLQSRGHEVTLARNGVEAVEAAARGQYDVVLMDVQMPVMDGIEATKRIRKLPAPAGEVPVLALSANVMAVDQARYMAAGMSGALSKPIDWPELFNALALYGGADKAADTDILTRQPVAADIVTPAGKDHVIDPATLDRLRRLQGATFIVKLTELFVRDTGRRLEELHDAVQRADASSVAQHAHAIKGSAANLGAHIMVQICTDIETCAKAADFTTAPVRVEALQHEFTRACNALRAIPTDA
jgi:signal transduction histidine kinase/DNA-binding response OmpR family regulator